jgi:L-asparaginase
MKKILVIFCGGTIAMKKNEKGTLAPFFNATELLDMIPALKDLADISIEQVANIDSTNMDPSIWSTLTKTIVDNYSSYDGFIVTHGTDTMAYTASALSFALQGVDKPIIFTGSQKPLQDVPSDAVNNLVNALLVALKGVTGVYIVFGTKILQGNRASKVSESHLDAFDSLTVSPAGSISLEPVITHPSPSPTKSAVSSRPNFDSRVLVVTVTPGLSREYIDAAAQAGCHGVILEGYGPGNVPEWLLPCIEDLTKKQIPVVILSQCRNGIPHMQLYEVGANTLKAGAISGGDMTVEAAVTKLMWILAETQDMDMIKKVFRTNISGEVTIYE